MNPEALILLAMLGVPPQAPPTTPINPTVVEFNCPDHALDSQHELKVLRIEGTNRVTITTILLGDPPEVDAATHLVRASLNVQPIAFGQYTATVNSGGLGADGVLYKSVDSEESNVFVRAPGGPGKPAVKGAGGGD